MRLDKLRLDLRATAIPPGETDDSQAKEHQQRIAAHAVVVLDDRVGYTSAVRNVELKAHVRKPIRRQFGHLSLTSTDARCAGVIDAKS